MKKKKLLKRIEEFKHDLEDLLEMNKYNSDPTFDVIEGFQRVKYCKECKLPMKQKVEMLEDRTGIRIKNHFNFHKL